MDDLRIHIRGQMGVQLLQTAAGMSNLQPGQTPIICVNTGGLDQAKTSFKLHSLFDVYCRVVHSDAMMKTPYWLPGVATKTFEKLDTIYDWIDFKIRPGYDRVNTAVHIRRGDKPVLSQRSIDEMMKFAEASNDPVQDVVVCDSESGKSDVEDWLTMFYAEELYAAPSAFIMSMLLVNPDKTIFFMGENWCDGGYSAVKNDFIWIREAMKYCPNVRIIEEP